MTTHYYNAFNFFKFNQYGSLQVAYSNSQATVLDSLNLELLIEIINIIDTNIE